MAHIFKTYMTMKDPVTGKRVTKLDSKGNKVQHLRWRFEYVDWRGKRTTGTGYESKRETEQLAAKLEREAFEIRKGYRDAPKSHNKQAARPFLEVAQEYLDWGNAQGGRGGRPWSSGHARNRKTRLLWWPEHVKLQVMADLTDTLPRVEKALREMGANGKAPKTRQNYAEALVAFCEWAVDRGYLESNPLAKLVGFDTTPLTIRRAMDRAEIHGLLNIAPEHRRLVYELAFTTGLRAGELKALTPDHLDLEQGGIRLDAEWTKNRKAGFMHVPAALLGRLVAYANTGDAVTRYAQHSSRKDCTAEVPANPLLFVPQHMARAMDEDMERAGIEKHTAEGKLDFHACRVAYINIVLASGVDVKTAQEAARHSTPSLTMNTYGRARAEAMANLAETIGGDVLLAQPEGCNITCPEQEIAKPITDCSVIVCSDKDAGSIPAASTMYQQTAAGTNVSSSGFLLSEPGKDKEVTAISGQKVGSDLSHTGTGHPHHGTANPLTSAHKSAYKSANKKQRGNTDITPNVPDGCQDNLSVEQLKTLLSNSTAIPEKVRNALCALLESLLAKD